VRACDKTQLVFLQEILDNVSAERERHTSVILAPTSYVLYIIAVQPAIYFGSTVHIHCQVIYVSVSSLADLDEQTYRINLRK